MESRFCSGIVGVVLLIGVIKERRLRKWRLLQAKASKGRPESAKRGIDIDPEDPKRVRWLEQAGSNVADREQVRQHRRVEGGLRRQCFRRTSDHGVAVYVTRIREVPGC
jgi:hypothetical protein